MGKRFVYYSRDEQWMGLLDRLVLDNSGALSCGDSGRGYIGLACLLISVPEKVSFYKDVACALCIFMQTHSGRRAWFKYIKTGNADINSPVFKFVSLFKQLKKTPENLFLLRSFLAVSKNLLILLHTDIRAGWDRYLCSFRLLYRLGLHWLWWELSHLPCRCLHSRHLSLGAWI